MADGEQQSGQERGEIRDFFSSFNKADRPWATWIAWVLEEAGYSVWFQDWDFSGNFVLEMDEALKRSSRMVAVLSPDFLTSNFTAPEWAAKFAQDPRSSQGLLTLVCVRECNPEGLLGQIVYVDLVGLGEQAARDALLRRVQGKRKPNVAPVFPGPASIRQVARKPVFPPTPAERTLAFHNLPPANPDFVGREDVLADLRCLLTTTPGPTVITQAIICLGGIGKTQTALAYCHHHLADYRLIWWLRAETPEVLAADYGAVAKPLGLNAAELTQAQLLQSVREALQQVDGWLLVFDNVDADPTLPRSYLPATGGHALITSRRTDWHGLACELKLKLMTEDEALLVLTSGADPATLSHSELAEAQTLARELGYLPLALAQAAAYIRETGETFAGYRELLRTSGAELLAEGRPLGDYPAPVARAWDVSISAAEKECEAARPLLELLACFAPEALPRFVLDGDALPAALSSKLTRNRAIAALARFSLITAEAGGLAVHRIVQAITRATLDESAIRAYTETAVALVAAALPFDTDYPSEWLKVQALLPHALLTAAEAERLEIGLTSAATILNQTALYYKSRAVWFEAEPLYQRAVAIGEKTFGSEHPGVSVRLSNLANLYQDTGRYAEAEPLHQRAVAIGEKVLGPDHPEVASWFSNLANVYQATSRYAEAEPLFQRAIAIGEKTLGPEHPKLAIRVNNLASLYRVTGRYAEAEPLFQRTIAIGEKALGPNHPDLATRLNNLAGLYWMTRRYAAAKLLLQRAIAILEKSLPPNHPNLRTARENYAILFNQLERHDEAAALRAEANVASP